MSSGFCSVLENGLVTDFPGFENSQLLVLFSSFFLRVGETGVSG